MSWYQSAQEAQHSDDSRLERLMAFLAHDPNNVNLLRDAAMAAYDEGKLDDSADLLDRYRQMSPLPPQMVNLEGLIALRSGRTLDAARNFDLLLEQGVGGAAIRFNRAWVHALDAEYQAILPLIDAEVIKTQPKAGALKIQALHHLGLLQEALAEGAEMVKALPQDDVLLGALSVVAMDADDFDLARIYAEKAGGGVDALTTRGLISLHEDLPADATLLFDQALVKQPSAPRALIGKGLALVIAGDVENGADYVTQGAQIFGDHLGSWIAAGWMHLLARDFQNARANFERVMMLDENFAESHGGLAVIAIAEGNLEAAKKRADIAIRLDKDCFGGMLAQMMLRDAAGNEAGAQRIWDKAMEMGIGPNGKTLGQAMIGFGFNPANRQRAGH